MNLEYQSKVLQACGAKSVDGVEKVQELWSGYGQILRLRLSGGPISSVIVKWVQIPTEAKHPRGWTSDIGHQRKLQSYRVESHWYQHYSKLSRARLAHCYAAEHKGDELLLVLEDLNSSGYPLRRERLNEQEFEACLAWLAQFHATYLGQKPAGLWSTGSYWHLATRPEEWAALKDQPLREAAEAIHRKLQSAKFQTLIHGDAKVANFCFGEAGAAAGVDFQYVGGGCGMVDLAYFVGSVLNEEECEKQEAAILDRYFQHLQKALPLPNAALETEWRSLYHVAWADFHRFLKGWSPGHWKINTYSEKICRAVIQAL